MEFKKLKDGNINEIEKSISKEWGGVYNILNKSIENRKDNERYVFYDGPATANGFPGLHHMMAKFLKDSFCKYQTMRGHKVLRKVGWDTHGLPVELQVEKELGFSGKKDIEKYGVEKFNKECRNIVWKNEEAFTRLTEEMGQFIDLKNPYVTYDNNYIETEWWILQKFFEEGLFYEGSKTLPYCPRCGTGLASHEVAQGYEESTANTVIVPFKKVDEEVYFLAWTTTPWTLSSNLALCVNPDEIYVKVESMDNKFILAKKLVEKVLGSDIKVLEEYVGKDLEYMEYEQLIDDFKVDKRAFFVTCADYVTTDDGTGIVHIAPAFGEDDNKVGKKYDLPYLNPIGDDGKYLDGRWKGMFVFDADIEVIKYLKENGKLFKKQKITHQYPHCWRCHTPLIYYSKPSFYIETTKLKDKIIEANKNVNWHPSFVGEKRFGNWLENMKDWAISRNRYWGTPLPLWRCDCGNEEMIGSRKELVEKSIEEIDDSIDLHRPYVDDIHIKCSKCGKSMKRVEDVIDCWFDSGSMPFAQYHYPFENKELWEEQYPADFIAEGIDQTRGWFYTLLVIGVFVTGKSPYKNVLVNDLLLDKFGKKMSKSKGNIVEPFSTISEYGADTVRFYLPYVSPVWTPLRFDTEGMKEIYSKYISTFKNAYSFFQMYANADSIDPREYSVSVNERELIDKWLLSKLNKLVKTVIEGYEEYDLNKVVHAIVPFLNDDLSNWYIRSNRRRFWDSELTLSKKSVYLTTYEVLVTLSKLVAPITPFIAEEIYTNLTGEESVHLADFPNVDEALINENIEAKMDLVRDICSLGRDAREKTNIKVRQPIQEIVLDSFIRDKIGNLDSIIKEELNVKDIIYKDDMTDYLTYSLKPNFKVLGKELGAKIKDLQNTLHNLSSREAFLVDREPLTIKLCGEDFTLDSVNTITSIDVKEGYTASANQEICVVLNTTLSEELVLEGLAREMVRTIQSIRKDKDFIITDHIKVFYQGDSDIDKMFELYKDYIMGEVLAEEVLKKDIKCEEYDINSHKCMIDIERIC